MNPVRARQNEATKRIRIAKMDYVNALKTAQACADCGEDDPVVLDFHHRDPATKHPRLKKKPNTLRSLSWPDLRVELDKCAVLCANCHRRRHHKEKTCQ